MSHSFHSADRSTHYKVIAVAFALSVAVGMVGLSVRSSSNFAAYNGTGLIKAAKMTHITTNDIGIIR